MTTSKPVSVPSPGVTPWRRVGWNSLWLLLARLASQALALGFSLLVARQLGEVVLGQYAFISTVLLIGNMATSLGTDTIVIRRVASDTDRSDLSDLLNTALLIQLALSGLVIATVWLMGGLLPNQTAETLPAFRLISLALIPIAFSSVLSAALRGRERMGPYLIFTLVTSLVLVVGALIVVKSGGGLFGLALATLVAQTAGALSAAGLFGMLKPRLAWRVSRPSTALIQRVASTGLILAVLMVVTLLLGRLGTVMLSLLADDAATGYFVAAARLVEGLKLIPTAALGALFPIMARQAGGGDHLVSLGRSLRRLLVVGVGAAIAVATVTALLAGPIIALLYGPGYEPSAVVLTVLVWVLPFSVVSLSVSFWLVAAGQERVVVVAMIPGLLISAVIMGRLIVHFGLLGAAIGSVATEAIQMAVLLIALRFSPRP